MTCHLSATTSFCCTSQIAGRRKGFSLSEHLHMGKDSSYQVPGTFPHGRLCFTKGLRNCWVADIWKCGMFWGTIRHSQEKLSLNREYLWYELYQNRGDKYWEMFLNCGTISTKSGLWILTTHGVVVEMKDNSVLRTRRKRSRASSSRSSNWRTTRNEQ